MVVALFTLLASLLRRVSLGGLTLAWALGLGAGFSHGAVVKQPAHPESRTTSKAFATALRHHQWARFAKAQAGFERLVRRGHVLAHYNLAVMHLQGEARPASIDQGLTLLKVSAEAGLLRSILAMAQLLEQGIVVPRDLSAAHDWVERAAKLDHPESQEALATAYYLGRGRPQNLAQAAHWYREAATRGEVGSQYILASMLERGEGLPLDLRLARYWYDVAAKNGDKAAPLKRDEIDAKMASSP